MVIAAPDAIALGDACRLLALYCRKPFETPTAKIAQTATVWSPTDNLDEIGGNADAHAIGRNRRE